MKGFCLHQCGKASLTSLRAWIGQNGERRMKAVSCLELEHPSSCVLGHWSSWFSGIWTLGLICWFSCLSPQTGNSTICSPVFQTFRLRLKYATAFTVLQLAHSKLWDFLASITAWASSYNKGPYIFLYIAYCFCLSGEPWLVDIPFHYTFYKFKWF